MPWSHAPGGGAGGLPAARARSHFARGTPWVPAHAPSTRCWGRSSSTSCRRAVGAARRRAAAAAAGGGGTAAGSRTLPLPLPQSSADVCDWAEASWREACSARSGLNLAKACMLLALEEEAAAHELYLEAEGLVDRSSSDSGDETCSSSSSSSSTSGGGDDDAPVVPPHLLQG